MDIAKKNVVTGHELQVGGVTLRDKRELIVETKDGHQVSTLIHTRWIEEKVYKVITTSMNGTVVDTKVDTQLSDEEVEDFQRTWNENWNPLLADGGAGQQTSSDEQDTSNTQQYGTLEDKHERTHGFDDQEASYIHSPGLLDIGSFLIIK